MEQLKELSPKERVEMIKNSQQAAKLACLQKPGGFECFMNSSEFSQEEKDYILFHISELEKISKMRIATFKTKVKSFKEDGLNA